MKGLAAAWRNPLAHLAAQPPQDAWGQEIARIRGSELGLRDDRETQTNVLWEGEGLTAQTAGGRCPCYPAAKAEHCQNFRLRTRLSHKPNRWSPQQLPW